MSTIGRSLGKWVLLSLLTTTFLLTSCLRNWRNGNELVVLPGDKVIYRLEMWEVDDGPICMAVVKKKSGRIVIAKPCRDLQGYRILSPGRFTELFGEQIDELNR